MKYVRHNNGMMARGGLFTLGDFEVIANVAENDEYRLHRFQQANTIVDVGANIGAFAVIARRMFPQARILCVEPFSGNMELLRLNAGHFAILERVAILHGKDSALLHVPRHDVDRVSFTVSAQADVVFTEHEWEPLETVPALTLSEVLERHGLIGPIDILKLDCEGAELAIIEQDPVIERVKHIVGEWHTEVVRDRIVAKLLADDWEIEITNQGHPVGHFFAEKPWHGHENEA